MLRPRPRWGSLQRSPIPPSWAGGGRGAPLPHPPRGGASNCAPPPPPPPPPFQIPGSALAVELAYRDILSIDHTEGLDYQRRKCQTIRNDHYDGVECITRGKGHCRTVRVLYANSRPRVEQLAGRLYFFVPRDHMYIVRGKPLYRPSNCRG